MVEKGRGAKLLHTDIYTYRQTYRPSDEAGPSGAFAPKKTEVWYWTIYSRISKERKKI